MTAGLGSVQYTGLARWQRHNLAVKAELKVIAPKVITLVITQPPSLPPPTLHTDLCVNESWNSKFWQNSSIKLQVHKLFSLAVTQNNTSAVVSCRDGQHYLRKISTECLPWLWEPKPPSRLRQPRLAPSARMRSESAPTEPRSQGRRVRAPERWLRCKQLLFVIVQSSGLSSVAVGLPGIWYYFIQLISLDIYLHTQ